MKWLIFLLIIYPNIYFIFISKNIYLIKSMIIIFFMFLARAIYQESMIWEVWILNLNSIRIGGILESIYYFFRSLHYHGCNLLYIFNHKYIWPTNKIEVGKFSRIHSLSYILLFHIKNQTWKMESIAWLEKEEILGSFSPYQQGGSCNLIG